jgi:hypothetical protein
MSLPTIEHENGKVSIVLGNIVTIDSLVSYLSDKADESSNYWKLVTEDPQKNFELSVFTFKGNFERALLQVLKMIESHFEGAIDSFKALIKEQCVSFTPLFFEDERFQEDQSFESLREFLMEAIAFESTFPPYQNSKVWWIEFSSEPITL